MIPGRMLAGAALLCVASNAPAQVYWQPEPAPLVTAESEPWLRLGEPITYEGYIYYPAGARVFFDGNVMVRSGAYRGIPIYVDTTIEAFSRLFVPVSGGMLQPYERRRTGDAAGTTGSRAPSFPVTMAGEPSEEPRFGSAAAATSSGVSAPETGATEPGAESTGTAGLPRAARHVVEAGRRPKGLNEIYVAYRGLRWRAAGEARPLDDERLVVIGRSGRFSVYADRGDPRHPRAIYIPSRPGFVARYERAGALPKY